ncbi:MAG: succinate--CoA ligase subunit beta, partial [Nitrosomonas sp.]
MNTHEYQAKAILKKYGIPVPEGAVVTSREEAKHAIESLHLSRSLVKVQVHAGGRGKAGGVKMAGSPQEIIELVDRMLGMKLVTNQTGKEGVIAHQLLLYAPLDIDKEFYLGAIIDRQKGQAVLIASPEGGMEIE